MSKLKMRETKNQKRARRIVKSWPDWMRKVTLTKKSKS